MVITELDPARMRFNLALAIVVPLVSFVVSVAFLVHAYHRMKRKDAAAAAAEALQQERDEAEAEADGDGDDDDEAAAAAPGCSHPSSSYSLKSITSKINSTVVRFAQNRDRRNGSG